MNLATRSIQQVAWTTHRTQKAAHNNAARSTREAAGAHRPRLLQQQRFEPHAVLTHRRELGCERAAQCRTTPVHRRTGGYVLRRQAGVSPASVPMRWGEPSPCQSMAHVSRRGRAHTTGPSADVAGMSRRIMRRRKPWRRVGARRRCATNSSLEHERAHERARPPGYARVVAHLPRRVAQRGMVA